VVFHIKKRLIGPDLLKFICTLFVICLHVTLPESIYACNYGRSFFQIAVPIFFMCSGYFFNCNNSIKHLVEKLIKFLIYSLFVYFVFGAIIFLFMQKGTLYDYLVYRLSIKSILKFFFFNECALTMYDGRHLWYISALIYVFFIEKIIRIKNDKIILLYSIFLLIVNFLLGSYSKLIFLKDFAPCLTRNFLFTGVPLFNIGRLIATYQNKKGRQINQKRYLNIFLILSFVLLIFESYMNDLWYQDYVGDMRISTILLSITVFCFFININNSKFFEFISKMSKKYGLYIYIMHPITIICLESLLIRIENHNILTFFSCIEPVLVMILTLLISRSLLAFQRGETK